MCTSMFGKKESITQEEVKVVTLIGEDCVFVGDLTAKRSVRIDGTVKGDVTVAESLVIGKSGKINGTVKAKNIFCSGQIVGNVIAEVKMETTETARIIGDTETSILVVDENAILQGHCNMHAKAPEETVEKKEQKEQPKSEKKEETICQ